MPTYDYACESCGEFELQQSIIEPARKTCPRCGGPVRRLISGGTGFILKGSSSAALDCGHEKPCCGRETRCDKPPCGK
ncbi:MAG: zinc ribbon domain-containing protein [Deltaproteobacteria bacterium]|nr:zinc ribbon domain-containing protein [Deltaproteobacteria bacterium]